jgi:hypothetical protein
MSSENFGGYTRVTEVLHRYYDFSRVDPAVLGRAAERGTEIHEICERMALGKPSEIRESHIPYVRNFDEWLRGNVEEVVDVERRFFHREFSLTGKVDLICRIKGDEGLTIVDIKTPAAFNPVWRAQMAAYKVLAENEGLKVTRLMVLRLGGKRPLITETTQTAPVDTVGFLNALRAHNYFEEIKGGKKMPLKTDETVIEAMVPENAAMAAAEAPGAFDEIDIDDDDLFGAFGAGGGEPPVDPEPAAVDPAAGEGAAPKKRARKAGAPRKPRARKTGGPEGAPPVFNAGIGENPEPAEAAISPAYSTAETAAMAPTAVIAGRAAVPINEPAQPAGDVIEAEAVLDMTPAGYFEGQFVDAKAKLSALDREILRWSAEASAITVDGPESKQAAAELLIPLEKGLKALDAARKGIVDGPNQFVKRVNAFANGIKERISEVTKGLRKKILDYAAFENLEAQRRAERERLAQLELQGKIQTEVDRVNAENRAMDPDAPALIVPGLADPAPAEAPGRVHTEAGTLSTAKRMDFRVIDPALVPREFLTVNEVAIRAAIRLGRTNIPGVEVFEDLTIRIR